MVSLFDWEQRQAGQQDIFQGADVVGRQAQPTPTVMEVATYLKDTTGANVIAVPEASLVGGSGGIGTDIEEFQTGQLGKITSDITMQPKPRKPVLPEFKGTKLAEPVKIAGLRPKTAEQTLADIEGFSSIATSAQQGGIIPDPSTAQQTAVGFPGSDVSSNLHKQPLAPITEQMQRAKLGAQEGLRVPETLTTETLTTEPQLKPEVSEGKGDAMGVPQLFNEAGAGKDADDIETIAEPDDFILNSKVKEIEGEKDIDTMLAGAIDIANKKGYRLSPRITNLPKDKVVPLLVSKDEIRVPKVLAKIIGYDKLTKMNERGKAAMKAEEQQQATGQQVAQAKHGGKVHSQKKKFKEGGKTPQPLEKNKADFLNNAVNVVQSVNKDNIIPSPIVLSIIAQETGWGTSRFVKEANNWFNMAVDKPDQKFVPAKDRPSHKVRSFGSGTESVSAFLEMVNTKPHYQPVRDTLIKYNKGNATEHEIIDAIANTGYAEDPNWANSIKDIHDRRIKPMFTKQKEYAPPSREFEEESKLNKEKIGRTIYDTIRKVEPHVTKLIKTGDLPKEQVTSFMSDAVQAKIGDAVVNKAKELDVYPNFLKQLDVSGRYKGKEDFSVQAGGFEWKEHPYYRSLSKTFGDLEGIHGEVGMSKSKYDDEVFTGGQLIVPFGKSKK